MTTPHLGIVILNWRRPLETAACLRSLEALSYPSYEVVVVDNGSTDGSADLIRQSFPGVAVIKNGCNLGFAGGNNVGMRYLLSRGVDYVLLLNDDTEVAPDMVTLLVEAGERAPGIGILGPTIYFYDAADVIWSGGGSVDRLGRTRHRRWRERDDALEREVQDVDYVTGCAVLAKREVIERVGLLDERFFAYFEETDWCARARADGFRVVYVPNARMWHKISDEDRAHSELPLYLMTRNRLLYLKCRGAGFLTLSRAALELLRTAASWRLRPRYRHMSPFAAAVARGVGDFVLGRFGAPRREATEGAAGASAKG